MKYLFLYAIAFLFLCTACFEKEEEIKVEEEIEIAPPEVDILECNIAKQFISYIESESPREPRSTIKEYKKNSILIFELSDGGNSPTAATTVPITSYHYSNCEFICSNAFGASGGQPCNSTFLDSLVYVETVWIDKR